MNYFAEIGLSDELPRSCTSDDRAAEGRTGGGPAKAHRKRLQYAQHLSRIRPRKHCSYPRLYGNQILNFDIKLSLLISIPSYIEFLFSYEIFKKNMAMI